MRILIPLLLFCFNLFSQSSVHYIGPVHSNQKNTLFAKEQYIYVTSPYNEGPVYVKISNFGTFQTNRIEMGIGRSISYKVGEDDETPLVITTRLIVNGMLLLISMRVEKLLDLMIGLMWTDYKFR